LKNARHTAAPAKPLPILIRIICSTLLPASDYARVASDLELMPMAIGDVLK
jgi:hypothetical protein